MENEIIVPAAVQRDSKVIAVEIRTITQQVQQTALQGAVEIGKRLVEAKGLVAHGDWGRWLREEVDYSQSTADNFMKIFREYSPALEANSQTIQNLSYTKALKLLALPAEEREAFAQEHKVEDMSTRELDKALAELKQAKAAQKAAEDKAVEAERKYASQLAKTNHAIAESMDSMKSFEEANLKAAAAEAEVKRLREELEKEKAKEPTVEIREVPADTTELEAKLKAAEEALAQAKKAQTGANPDVVAFRVLFEETQAKINQMRGYILRLEGNAPEIAQNLKKALGKLAEAVQGAAA